MIVIRDEQMQVFQAVAVERYVGQCVARVERCFPAQLALHGRDGVEALVRDGVARAERYAVADDAEVDRFIDLMLTVALDFDSRSEMAWAAGILASRGLDEHAKMDLIYASPKLPAAARR
jgi:hypothetical protein